jgi:uncharacterized membrane protein YkvA (DUF1232 family)
MFIKPSFWRLLLHLPKLIRLVLGLMKDRRVPAVAKAVFFLCVAYVVWPVDLIPDLLVPVIGSLDDVAVLLAGLRYLLYRTPPHVLQEHLSRE